MRMHTHIFDNYDNLEPKFFSVLIPHVLFSSHILHWMVRMDFAVISQLIFEKHITMVQSWATFNIKMVGFYTFILYPKAIPIWLVEACRNWGTALINLLALLPKSFKILFFSYPIGNQIKVIWLPKKKLKKFKSTVIPNSCI